MRILILLICAPRASHAHEGSGFVINIIVIRIITDTEIIATATTIQLFY